MAILQLDTSRTSSGKRREGGHSRRSPEGHRQKEVRSRAVAAAFVQRACHVYLLEAGELAETAVGGVAAGGTMGGVLDASAGAPLHPVEAAAAGADAEDADEVDLLSLSSPWQWMQCMHTVHRPVILARLVRSLSAGPRRMPM